MLAPLDHAQAPEHRQRGAALRRPRLRPGPEAQRASISGARRASATASRRARPPRAGGPAGLRRSTRAGSRCSTTPTSSAWRSRYLGHSLNTSDQAEIDAAAEVLITAKPNFKAFAPDTGQDLLISGEVDVCMEWSGDISQVMVEDDDLAYVVPEEGALLWVDCICDRQGCAAPGQGARLHQLHPRRPGARRRSPPRSATPARTRRPWRSSPPRIATTPRSIPSDATLAKCEFATYKGEAVESLYETALTRVLAA